MRNNGKRRFKWVGRATLPAGGRRLSGDGVRGKPPTKTGSWARLFARWGGKFFAAPPGLQKPRGRGCLQMGSATQISHFCEMEFTRLTPLFNSHEGRN
ncbi:hypothetical protein Dda3937_03408 [Dickeya dadantii 3937]|uniref:Uncharacterized protein n=1 Tax=Dickeya dadantii (strain 3937) TaxID=198628 RepID=E0SBS6_DICD3|nr:hypothetical protein Dda3937_03408 [Dickeya dadantii 3937]